MTWRHETGLDQGNVLLPAAGLRLAVAREGQGPAVVCLHAIGHGGRDFEAFAKAVRHRFEVIRVDWPGQGCSEADVQPASAARYAQLLTELLDQLAVVNPIIVGNSIGGATAILYATRRPVRALVLCDSGGLLPISPFLRVVVGLFVRFFRAGERGAGWFTRAFSWYYRFIVLPAAAAADQRQRIIRSAVEIAPILRAAWQSFARPDADLRAQVCALDIPIWCAWSRQDRVIPLWMCRPAIRRMRHARLSLFNGGHAAFLEQPQQFAEDFCRFADQFVTRP